MFIIKLKKLYNHKPEYGASLPALKIGKYKYVRQSDINSKNFSTFVNSGPLLRNNDILISRVGSNAGETYIHDSNENCVFAGFLVRYNFDESKLKNKYFYYWTKTNIYKNQVKKLITGSGQPQFNPPIVSELKIFIPNIEIQQKIIGIIEPFEILENKILNLLKYIQNLFLSRNLEINNFIKESISWKSNGYPYKDPDKDILGLYKIFTIKNINDNTKFLKTNIMKNNLISIGDIITGLSGTIGTTSVVCENDWVSNQRTLVLRSKLPLNIKISIEKQNDLLMHYATGAVQKNITSDNILNLKMIEKNINDEYINQFYIILLILKNKIIKIKKYAINLLID